MLKMIQKEDVNGTEEAIMMVLHKFLSEKQKDKLSKTECGSITRD